MRKHLFLMIHPGKISILEPIQSWRFGWKKGTIFPGFQWRAIFRFQSFILRGCRSIQALKNWFLKKKRYCLRTHTPCWNQFFLVQQSLATEKVRGTTLCFFSLSGWIMIYFGVHQPGFWQTIPYPVDPCMHTYTLVIVSSLRLNFPPKTFGFQLFPPVLSSFNRSKISSNCSPCTATPLWISWDPDQWKGLTCIGRLFE